MIRTSLSDWTILTGVRVRGSVRSSSRSLTHLVHLYVTDQPCDSLKSKYQPINRLSLPSVVEPPTRGRELYLPLQADWSDDPSFLITDLRNVGGKGHHDDVSGRGSIFFFFSFHEWSHANPPWGMIIIVWRALRSEIITTSLGIEAQAFHGKGRLRS